MKDLLLVGASLENQLEAQQDLVNKLKENQLYKQLISDLEEKFNLDLKKFDVLDSFKFASERENIENTHSKGAGLKLSYNNNQVLLTAIFLENEAKLNLKLISTFVNHVVEGNDILTKIIAENGKISEVFAKEFDDKLAVEHEDNILKKQFPVNEAFFASEQEDAIVPLVQRVGSGCLWGGYQWCGLGCSNYKDRGGDGTAINTTDVCCMMHDYCYRNGNKHSTCDASLCKCISSHSTTASALIKVVYC
ncbi:hypothetical protein [Priestia megaterium]|uniref:hypothetical protein n=1 Tax=Priestia megaterium TaxID=1404 RepID=UPI001A93B3E1|nr:hypothetical protein [Priestia megaterium]QSX24154.1 hypothetical protein J0P05_31495 [Priestia megaterium]